MTSLFKTNIFSFYTTYAVFACVIHYYFPSMFDITYIAIITFCIGSYISFRDPKEYYVIFNNKEYTFSRWKRFFITDIIHIAVFAYGLYVYFYTKIKPSTCNFVMSFTLTILYMVFTNLNIYKIKNQSIIFYLFSIISLFYLIFVKR